MSTDTTPALRPGYYAIPDPDQPDTMTYWRVHADGRTITWPRAAWYGPARPLKRDAPTGRDERTAWLRAWHTRYAAWLNTIHTELQAEPDAARHRFAAFTTRCSECGRRLTDATSKTLGIGPDCRRTIPDTVLARLQTPAVAAAHAAYLKKGSAVGPGSE